MAAGVALVSGDVVCERAGDTASPCRRNTVASRIDLLDPGAVAQAREGSQAARSLRAAGGTPPAVDVLLEQVQVDHTVIDVIVVDERDPLPIGRP